MHRHVPEFMTSISSLRIYLNISSMFMLYEGWKSAVRICEACCRRSQLILRPKLSPSRKRKTQIYIQPFHFFLLLFFLCSNKSLFALMTLTLRILPKFQFLIRGHSFSFAIFIKRFTFEYESVPRLQQLISSHEHNNEI